MLKNELRKKYKHLRAELSFEEKDKLSVKIANQLLKLNIWQYNNYHLFLMIESLNEVNTNYVLQILHGKDKNCIISKSNFENREMTHFLLTDATKIKLNKYNIPEPINGIEVQPKQVEVVFVPLLAYDKTGNRVGYGKGFYDNFLKKCNSDTLKIGISFFEAEEQISESFENDIPLDYCVTPKNIYNFKTNEKDIVKDL